MKALFRGIKPKKVLVCQSCKTKFQFPIKPGKTLKVTCPNCSASYEVTFVNPLVELVKGRLKWTALTRSEKRNLFIVILSIVVCLGVVVSSVLHPVRPKVQSKNALSYVI